MLSFQLTMDINEKKRQRMRTRFIVIAVVRRDNDFSRFGVFCKDTVKKSVLTSMWLSPPATVSADFHPEFQRGAPGQSAVSALTDHL